MSRPNALLAAGAFVLALLSVLALAIGMGISSPAGGDASPDRGDGAAGTPPATQPAENSPKGPDPKPGADEKKRGGSTTTGKPSDKIDVPQLVKEVWASELWMDSVKSFSLRGRSEWTFTPTGIAIRRAELKKQFPAAKVDEETFPELRPKKTDTFGIAFDATRAAKWDRLEGGHESRWVWDGRQLLVYWKDLHADRSSYRLAREYGEDLNQLLGCLAWPRAGRHVFWWQSTKAKALNLFPPPEDFVLTGREMFHGQDCHVLMAPMLNSGNDYRWHVSVADHRLRGLASGWARDSKQRARLLSEIALREGFKSDDEDELWKWLESLPPAKKAKLHREYRHKKFVLFQPAFLKWYSGYREVGSGRWLPMKQGYTFFEVRDGRLVETQRREMQITEVRVNQKLDASLFQAVPTEEGAAVWDAREDPPLSYKFKKGRTQEGWARIRQEAKARAARRNSAQRFRDGLVGKPAPAFPAGAKWLNSKPLTWKDLAGKIVVLDFWSESCGPCRNDLSHLADMHKERASTGVVAIGVHTPTDSLEKTKKLMKEFGLEYPICIDVPGDGGPVKSWGRMFSRYGVQGIPYAFVIDKEGRVAAHGQLGEVLRKVGELTSAPKPQGTSARIGSGAQPAGGSPKEPAPKPGAEQRGQAPMNP